MFNGSANISDAQISTHFQAGARTLMFNHSIWSDNWYWVPSGKDDQTTLFSKALDGKTRDDSNNEGLSERGDADWFFGVDDLGDFNANEGIGNLYMHERLGALNIDEFRFNEKAVEGRSGGGEIGPSVIPLENRSDRETENYNTNFDPDHTYKNENDLPETGEIEFEVKDRFKDGFRDAHAIDHAGSNLTNGRQENDRISQEVRIADGDDEENSPIDNEDADIFVFVDGTHNTTITDFDADEDIIDLSALLHFADNVFFTNGGKPEMLDSSAMYYQFRKFDISVEQIGEDTVISIETSTPVFADTNPLDFEITLEDFNAEDLTFDDFNFV